jgi:hypothetical protein
LNGSAGNGNAGTASSAGAGGNKNAIDAVANGSSLDISSAAFKQAMSACQDLEPPGFTGGR